VCSARGVRHQNRIARGREGVWEGIGAGAWVLRASRTCSLDPWMVYSSGDVCGRVFERLW